MSDELKVPRLLTAKELAATLNVAPWHIYQLVAGEKGPPSMLLGKTLGFPEDGVVR